MADFCKQCSIATFGEDGKDLAGITTAQQMSEGKAAVVICEGCGLTYVDPDGVCINPHCDHKHGENNLK